MLQRLPRLAVLEMPDMSFSPAAVQQLAARQGLRQVSLSQFHRLPPCDLQRLPSSITKLRIKGEGYSLPSRWPLQLPQLTGLLQLHLWSCAFLPTLLGSMAQLQALHLQWCLLLPNDSDGTAAFVDMLRKLSRLEDLQLRTLNLDAHSVMPESFSALTASSHLIQLAVKSGRSVPVPQGAVQHMFAAGRQLPQLTACDLSTYINPFLGGLDRYCIAGADLELISRCCPALRCLGINGTVQPDLTPAVCRALCRSSWLPCVTKARSCGTCRATAA